LTIKVEPCSISGFEIHVIFEQLNFRVRRDPGTIVKVRRRTTGAIICPMRSRASQIIVALVLFTCLVCPLVEMFDQWDHTIQTGIDTEYTFVVLGLCVGVAYTFVRFVFGIPLLRSVAELLSDLYRDEPLPLRPCGSFCAIPIALSPPALALRI
jgi:hypothetical protein